MTTPPPESADSHAPWAEDMAQWYTDHYGEHSSNFKTMECADLVADDQLLDIGCGSGAAVREAARIVTHGKAVGLDFSPAMIRIAKEKTSEAISDRVEYVVGSAISLPFEKDSMTVVTAINSIHHWPNPAVGLAEVRRVLQPGGKLLVTDDVLSEEERAQRHTFDAAKVHELLSEAGFSQIESEVFNNPDGTIVVVKGIG